MNLFEQTNWCHANVKCFFEDVSAMIEEALGSLGIQVNVNVSTEPVFIETFHGQFFLICCTVALLTKISMMSDAIS